MARTRIKICGITNEADALAAVEAGADAVGLVLYPSSKRCISHEIAAAIVRNLPPFVTPVGLFVNATVDDMRRAAETIGLRTLQLHGTESPQTIAALPTFTILKALPVRKDHFQSDLAQWRQAIADHHLTNLAALLLETAHTSVPGGSGIANDWEAIRRTRDAGAFADLPPIITAGGLTPATVAAVVRDIRPYAVDVSSGVEDSPRQKSPAKLKAFITAVATAIPQT